MEKTPLQSLHETIAEARDKVLFALYVLGPLEAAGASPISVRDDLQHAYLQLGHATDSVMLCLRAEAEPH